jgi:hypothetical protein
LAAAQNAVSQALASSGFVDIAATFAASFTSRLHYHHAQTELTELMPGVLATIMSWVTAKLKAKPQKALAAQANIAPEAAVPLLK